MNSKAIARIVPINGNKHEEFYAATLNEKSSQYAGTDVNGEKYHCFKHYWKVEMLPVEWDGEGLPPVGTECEYTLNNGSTWNVCTINTIVGTQGVVMNCDVFEGVQYVSLHSYPNTKFRPIRSARDKAVDAMIEWKDSPTRINETYYHAVYDAIAAGKIPGIKLNN